MNTLEVPSSYEYAELQFLQPRDTNLSPGAVIQLITWLLVPAMFFGVATSLLSRWFLVRHLGRDHVFIGMAFVFALAQSLCVVVPKSPIWGQRVDKVKHSDLLVSLKLEYTSNLLFYTGLCFGKLSVVFGLLHLTPSRWHRLVIICVGSAIIAWIVTVVFAVAFQCSLPNPWDVANKQQCRNLVAIYLYATIGNIVTDIAIVVIPLFIVIPLQMPLRNRLYITALLSARVLVIGATVVQAAFLPGSVRGDYILGSLAYSISLEVVQAVSVLTCSLPHFKPFLKILQLDYLFKVDLVPEGAKTNDKLLLSIDRNLKGSVRAETSSALDNHRNKIPLRDFHEERHGSLMEDETPLTILQDSD